MNEQEIRLECLKLALPAYPDTSIEKVVDYARAMEKFIVSRDARKLPEDIGGKA